MQCKKVGIRVERRHLCPTLLNRGVGQRAGRGATDVKLRHLAHLILIIALLVGQSNVTFSAVR